MVCCLLDNPCVYFIADWLRHSHINKYLTGNDLEHMHSQISAGTYHILIKQKEYDAKLVKNAADSKASFFKILTFRTFAYLWCLVALLFQHCPKDEMLSDGHQQSYSTVAVPLYFR